ncbi:urease subunit beta [Blochmannia endosymbiont of Colobopsis nipponica]|uniref:urease subunit beta n=1 Tax=Blochmannia endosymbiont of Colobopsis nipponica TaxID=2681987 RepID=UPI00177DEB63|nr:urease subunit beta [Blochmannia endosymbiont of Colobopsis nipponica]QOI10947.1 urease subunit beta [Blochmannia endosymbiont of Colobopsis nipponica]
MIPGEMHLLEGNIMLNMKHNRISITVANHGDRSIQVGSHFHFYEVNSALKFNRVVTIGFRLDIPSGTSVRFEPGQLRDVYLVNYTGRRKVYGFCGLIMGKLL